METLAPVLIVALIAAVMYGSYRWSLRSWDARIRGWAHDQKLHLLSFRGASFHEGPDRAHRFARSEYQTTFHVRVCDRTGRQRTAWLVFGDAFEPTDELVGVYWDD